jgi:ABC-2 type transport system ATP-binding protein
LIETFSLSREFHHHDKRIIALDDVTLKISKSERVALIGPNGAGKTTLIKILTTLLPPTSGQAWVNGFSILNEGTKVRKSIGVLIGAERGFNIRLSGFDNLLFWTALYDLPLRESRERASYLLSLVGLSEYGDIPLMKYSLGMKKKLALARALIPDPEVIVLDEPTSGIDLVSAINLKELIRSLLAQKTLLFTSHIMKDVDDLAHRAIFIKEGKIIADLTLDEIKQSASLEDTYLNLIGKSDSDFGTGQTQLAK